MHSDIWFPAGIANLSLHAPQLMREGNRCTACAATSVACWPIKLFWGRSGTLLQHISMSIHFLIVVDIYIKAVATSSLKQAEHRLLPAGTTGGAGWVCMTGLPICLFLQHELLFRLCS